MTKNIIIIGGGISGLAVLHYLNQKYAGDGGAKITLLEKNNACGGTICSLREEGCLFETGPNGFLHSKPRTLELVSELGLTDRLVQATDDAKIRYICVGRQLHALPVSPASFLKFPLLNPLQKLRVLMEPLVPKGGFPEESVYEFGRRRLGRQFAELFIDPMISGIYGGDARKTNLKAVFPRMYQLEQKYGSLIKAMLALRKRGNPTASGMPKGTLTSLRNGMSELIEALGARYASQIGVAQEVLTVTNNQNQFTVYTQDKQYSADQLFVCSPAYHASKILNKVSEPLAKSLAQIYYVPIIVVGLVFKKSDFLTLPKGFGYIIPSSERKKILGILFESNIFPERCGKDEVLLRIMVGGSRYPEIMTCDKDYVLSFVIEEAHKQFSLTAKPQKIFYKTWQRAIPQYDEISVDMGKVVSQELQLLPGLFLVANYRRGVSLNDCIESAYQAVQPATKE